MLLGRKGLRPFILGWLGISVALILLLWLIYRAGLLTLW